MSRDEDAPPGGRPRAPTHAAKPWKRIATILAGPAVNILAGLPSSSAWIFWIGPTLQTPTTTVDQVSANTPAAAIGLRPGDTVLSVNGVGRGNFTAIQHELQVHPGKVVTVRFSTADGQVRTVPVRLANDQNVGKLGFSPRLKNGPNVSSGFGGGIVDAGRYTQFLVEENVKGIGRIFTSEKARNDVSSVVGIGAAYNQVSEDGALTVLRFIGVISLVLGVFNLLPLLPLDGGHILIDDRREAEGQPGAAADLRAALDRGLRPARPGFRVRAAERHRPAHRTGLPAPLMAAPRRPSVPCRVGAVVVGGGAPVVVQSMTNTDTADAAGTARQIAELAEAGSEIVRITVNNRRRGGPGGRDPRPACATSTG